MSEIEVGEYVRTKNNYIRKVITERLNGYLVDVSYYNEIIDDTTLGIIGKEDIKKHSKNIKDLIEVKDVIKYRINNISTTLETKGYVEGIVDISDEEMLQRIKNDKNYEVLEILTHQQYMANCYKLGGEKCM